MTKTFVLCVAAVSLCAPGPRCVAQEVVPVIYLSAGETANAKQTALDLKSAEARDSRARTAWRSFCQMYQAAHPELPNLRFSSDFRFAFTRRNDPSGPSVADAVELSAEERQKAELLHREMLEAKRALDQAEKNWRDYQYELAVDHVPNTEAVAVFDVKLSSGRSVKIPIPWVNGMAFTPDFRVAVPR